jgi:hypothetical protein
MKSFVMVMTGGALAALATAQPAAAAVLQRVQVFYEDTAVTPSVLDEDQDGINVAAPEDIDRAVHAEIGGGPRAPYGLSASAGVFGAVGLNGFGASNFGSLPGEYYAGVFVSASDIVNAGASPARASTSFVIDGGMMELFGGPGSEIAFNLRLDAEITDANGGLVSDRTVFEADVGVLMTGVNTPPLVTITGDDISARSTGNSLVGAVVIDPSLQTVDIGFLQPNQSLTLSYIAAFDMTIEGFAESAAFAFSDPLTVQFDPDDDEAVRQAARMGATGLPVTLTPVTAVPLPAAAPLLLGGLGALGLMRRRRRSVGR